MRADRLLSIMMLLQAHGRMTAGALAKRLEVSARTVHRDMEALSAAGIPVVAERGSGGGWSLLEGYRTDLTGLTGDEIQTLFLAAPQTHLRDLGLQQAAEAALLRLLALLPVAQRRDATFMQSRIHVDGAGWRETREETPSLPIIQAALWQERRLWITYGRDEAATTERLVDPLGLVAQGRAWYLVAGKGDEIRTYRVSRVRTARLDAEASQRPPDFDLAATWAASKASFVANLPRFEATLRAAPGARERMAFSGRFSRLLHAEPPGPDNWSQLRIQADTADEAAAYVLGFGDQVEVLEPLSLRDEVIRQARALLAFYAR
ncbi:MAG TPA: YafY family protein [Symbiobacteriaceae bacterium]|nr:YafY family protein [Symbiobacteriaceae bacterium]